MESKVPTPDRIIMRYTNAPIYLLITAKITRKRIFKLAKTFENVDTIKPLDFEHDVNL